LIEGAKEFAAKFNVSRETTELLQLYQERLTEWQRVKNLVAPGTLSEIWHRHFADSAQVMEFVGDSRIIVDLGSGAGFPGMVIAILMRNSPDLTVHLVEANARKCAFLKDIARQAGVGVEIHNCRIEVFAVESTIPIIDLVTARALKPLSELLRLSQFAFEKEARGVFLKGKTADAEIKAAQKLFDFEFNTTASETDLDAKIVEIKLVKPRG